MTSLASGRQACEELGAKVIAREELFERARVVAVESDVRNHAAQALLALKAGKHVHLEEPPATTLADMQAIVGLAREKNLLLQTGFMWRYNPGFRTILEAVRQGWLGKSSSRAGLSVTALPLRAGPSGPGMAVVPCSNWVPHLVDATVRLLGKPKAVTPFLRRQGKFEDALKDNNVAVVEYDRATAVLVKYRAAGGSRAASLL